MKTAAFFPSAVMPWAVASLARPRNFKGTKLTNANRQAIAVLITRQILQSGFAECKLQPSKTRSEVFANVVKSFEEVLQPWGFAATFEPGPRSRGGVRVIVKELQ